MAFRKTVTIGHVAALVTDDSFTCASVYYAHAQLSAFAWAYMHILADHVTLSIS